jgi:hypothetical protein
MNPEYRRELLAIMARIEQLMAAAETLSIEMPEDDVLLRTSELFAEHKYMLAVIERKLQRQGRNEQP